MFWFPQSKKGISQAVIFDSITPIEWRKRRKSLLYSGPMSQAVVVRNTFLEDGGSVGFGAVVWTWDVIDAYWKMHSISSKRSIAHHLLNTLFTYIQYIYIHIHIHTYMHHDVVYPSPNARFENKQMEMGTEISTACRDATIAGGRWRITCAWQLQTSGLWTCAGGPGKMGWTMIFFGYQGRGWVSKLWRFEQEHRFFLCIYTYMYIYTHI